jgi:hypothetical protein
MSTALLSVESVDSVLASLGSSGRVKYSCVGISKSFIILGASTGSVYQLQTPQHYTPKTKILSYIRYLFDRTSLSFIRVISSAGILLHLLKG